MSKRRIVLGIDTSNYTTSAALMYDDGKLIANLKYPLPVKEGERGLRQSDALFSHIKNISPLMEDVRSALNGENVAAVGVSTKPRNADGSYMPCFLAGKAVAEGIGASISAPVYQFSHQCGHMMAAIYSSEKYDLLSGKTFCAFHVSGGTTEMLKVTFIGDGFNTDIIGGTADLNAGQVIDRIGVYMGLTFPAGPEMEKLALKNKTPIPHKKPKLDNFKINFSGLENMAVKLFDTTQNRELTAAFVLEYISNALLLLANSYVENFGQTEFLFAGGVMSNSIIKNRLKKELSASFADPPMSSDNAVGIAALTLKKIK